MRFSTGNRRLGLALAMAIGVFASAVLASSAANAAPMVAVTALPALDVTGTVDNPTAASGDAVTVTVTVQNIGTASAKNIHEANHGSAGDFALPGDPQGWNGIVWSNANGGLDQAFDLDPGQTRTVTYSGVVDDWAFQHGRAMIIWFFQPDGAVAQPTGGRDPRLTLTVAVPGAAGSDVRGTICKGAQFEVLVCDQLPGGQGAVGVPDVKVTLLDPAAHDTAVAETTSDGSGNFAFHNVPPGLQYFRFVAPAGWELSASQLSLQVVSGDSSRELALAAKWVGAGPAPTAAAGAGGSTTAAPTTDAGLPGADPSASAGGAVAGADKAPPAATGLVASVGGAGLLTVWVVLALLLVAAFASVLLRRRRARPRHVQGTRGSGGARQPGLARTARIGAPPTT